MKVSDVMKRDVKECAPIDPMQRAAQIMWEQDCGCVPVVDAENKVRGMITDRDLTMAAYMSGNDLRALPVERAMAREVRSCRATDDVGAVLKLMSEHQLHRLPVVDGEGRLQGVVSLSDIVQSIGQEGDKARRQWSEQIFDALAELTRPRENGPALKPTKVAQPVAGKRLEAVANSPTSARPIARP